MMWSFSAHGSFRKCPRQWYYKKVLASSRAKNPIRKEAARLGKLESIPAWRGKIVDSVISETIIPSIIWKRPCTLDSARMKADHLFATQRTQRLNGNGTVTFFEAEYGQGLLNEAFEKARAEIHTALENFFRAELLWSLLTQAKALVPQRPLSFKHDQFSVRVVPDLITFQAPRAPTILDWKVNTYAMRDYRLQLATGAIGVTRCNPHKDWPNGAAKHNVYDVELMEVQLLIGDIRVHTITESDVYEVEDLISISATEMELACGGKDSKDLSPEDFAVASDPKTCQMCSFRKLCWEGVT